MYDAFAPRINGKRSTWWLSARDPQDVATIKKPIAAAYSFSTVSDYEPLVDEMITKFISRLDEEFAQQKGRVCDMALWLRLCTLIDNAVESLSEADSMQTPTM